MQYHEREFFISLIRTGKVFIEYKDIELEIIPPTTEQVFRSCQVYNKVFLEAYNDDVMTEEETLAWMKQRGLWSKEKDEKIEGYNKDIEKLRLEIYNARKNEQLRENIRRYLRAGEKQLSELMSEKNQYLMNTCEGLATAEKSMFIIKNTTYLNNKLYEFDELSLTYITNEWQESFLSDKQIRELARDDPWKSLWLTKDKAKIKLFHRKADQELTINQKALVIWSQMYDNIQESLDCPESYVINDDDLLDGWFIAQNKKREREKREKEFEEETKNSKIKNSGEIFVMSKNAQDVDRINSMNDVNSHNIKKQRSQVLKNKKSVEQQDFLDEQFRIRSQQTDAYKSRFKGGR